MRLYRASKTFDNHSGSVYEGALFLVDEESNLPKPVQLDGRILRDIKGKVPPEGNLLAEFYSEVVSSSVLFPLSKVFTLRGLV